MEGYMEQSTSDSFIRLIEKIESFEASHVKIELPERRKQIKQLYKDFCFIFEDCTSTIEERENDIKIFIATNDLLTCKDGGDCFNHLIGLADIMDMKVKNNQVIFKLDYYLYEWVQKKC